MDSLLTGLNEAQKAAVTSEAAVLQILAPPGSGKTKTLTSRVAYMVSHYGLDPRSIIVCTFTVKAAREMRERVRGYLGAAVADRLVLGTFHAISRRYLNAYGKHIGLPPKFGIADTSDSTNILKRIIKRLGLTIKPAQAKHRISNQKAKSISAEQFAILNLKSAEKQEFVRVYSGYEAYLKLSNLLDFDDLLLRCLELLQKRPECVSNIQALLVDEFQDTNVIQYQLVQLLAWRSKRITTVGDPDQSIYGWRSADVENLVKMQRDYPDTQIVKLEENYRSAGAILCAAQEVIEQDTARPSKCIVPTHSVGMKPVLRRLRSAEKEAKWIVAEVKRLAALSCGLLQWSDFSVLLRSASLSRLIEKHMGMAGIPYRMVGGPRFFDRTEIRLVLDYLRVIDHHNHSESLARILNVPSRRIGETTLRRLLTECEERHITLWELLELVSPGGLITGESIPMSAQRGIRSFVATIDSATEKLREPCQDGHSLKCFIEHIIQDIGLQSFLKENKTEDFESRWSNVEELLALASDLLNNKASLEVEHGYPPGELGTEISDNLPSVGDALSEFLANVALSTDAQKTEDGEKAKQQVVLSTIHAAKGLEWPVVFIPAAHQGMIPHSRAEDVDEERRLLYVAMTRAQVLLYISVPDKSSIGDQTTMSPFLSERSVQPYFDEYGPELNWEGAKETARILGRPSPSKDSLESMLARAGRILDKDEEEGPDLEDASDKGSRSYQAWSVIPGDPYQTQTGFKRSWIGRDEQRPKYVRQGAEGVSVGVFPAEMTTMEQLSNFSTARTVYDTFVNSKLANQTATATTVQVTVGPFQEQPSSANVGPPVFRPISERIGEGASCTGNRNMKPHQTTLSGFLNLASQAAAVHESADKRAADDSIRAAAVNFNSPCSEQESISRQRVGGLPTDAVADVRGPSASLKKTGLVIRPGEAAAKRKTLGTRRDVVGWKAGSAGFKPVRPFQ